jgi:hypothetical protein
MDGILRWRVLERVRGTFRISNGRLFGGKLDIRDRPIPIPHIGRGFHIVDSSKELILYMLS